MTTERLVLAQAIADAGIERDKAERIASVIFDAIHDNVVTKADLDRVQAVIKADMTDLLAHLRGESSQLHNEVRQIDTNLRSEIARITNRTLIRISAVMVVLLGILFAALHYWLPGHG